MSQSFNTPNLVDLFPQLKLVDEFIQLFDRLTWQIVLILALVVSGYILWLYWNFRRNKPLCK